MDCWASILGDCGGGQSREHYISDGIFDGTVIKAFGLHWCKDRPVAIGLRRAAAKILCKTHNEALSQYDAEATKLSRFLSAGVRDNPLANEDVTLSGALLEKWSLKTLLNLGYVGALDQNNFACVQPPPDVVKRLFQKGRLEDGMGLYFVSGSISSDSYGTGLSWNTIRHTNSHIIGMTFAFNGVRFIVTTVPERAEKQIAGMGVVNGVDYSRATVHYRPPIIRLTSKTAGLKIIHLDW